MHVIHAHNVNDAFRQGLRLVCTQGERTESRNGPVLRMTMPVSTVYEAPAERVLMDSTRHANPFFHLFEALWMLNGGNDVETMDGFVKSFKQFSDDGITFHGAYGHRWRHWPKHTTTYTRELDQLESVIAMLKKDPTNRRIVIGMWDPARDLDADSKDIPCNDMIKVWGDQHKQLHMVVFNRSNDVVYGCYGANAVHMSMLHEYLSRMSGLVQGRLTQISCDFHAYLETPYNLDTFVPPNLDAEAWTNPYDEQIGHLPLIANTATFDDELFLFMDAIKLNRSVRNLVGVWTNPFFQRVAMPMHAAWEEYRDGRFRIALEILYRASEYLRTDDDRTIDWLQSGIEWINENLQRKAAKIPRETFA